MLEWLLKYWLEVLFVLVTTGLGAFIKHYRKLYIAERDHQKTEEQKAFYQGLQDLITQGDARLQGQIDIIKSGILWIQGTKFKANCKDLLRPDIEIDVETFEELEAEHTVYNSLGGNHDGDQLFDLVREKFAHDIT